MPVATASTAGSHGCQARQTAPRQQWSIREEEELCLEEDHAEEVRSDTPPAHEGREGTVHVAILTLAIVVAVLGSAVHFLWIGALVLMGVLWGVMVAERQQRQGTVKGLAAAMVTTVVDEAKGVMDATSGSDPEGATPSSRSADRTG
jgi:hypothetical protein